MHFHLSCIILAFPAFPAVDMLLAYPHEDFFSYSYLTLKRYINPRQKRDIQNKRVLENTWTNPLG